MLIERFNLVILLLFGVSAVITGLVCWFTKNPDLAVVWMPIFPGLIFLVLVVDIIREW